MLIAEQFAVSANSWAQFWAQSNGDAELLTVTDGKEAYGFDIASFFLSGRRVLRLASGDGDQHVPECAISAALYRRVVAPLQFVTAC